VRLETALTILVIRWSAALYLLAEGWLEAYQS